MKLRVFFFLWCFSCLLSLPFVSADPYTQLEKKAQTLFQKGNYYQSSLLYEELTQKSPRIEYYSQLVRLYRYLYHPKKMKQALEIGLKLDPENTELLIEQARYFSLQEKFEQATPYLEQVLQKESENMQALLEIAENSIRLKDFLPAYKYISKASQINSDLSRIYQLWASYHFRMKNNDLAINYCWYLLDNFDPTLFPLLKLGNGWVHSKAEPEPPLEPENPTEIFQKAYQLYQEGKYEQAKKLFETEPEEFANNFYLGCIYLHQKKHQKAQKAFEFAFKLRPRNARNLNAFGLAQIFYYRSKQALHFHPIFKQWQVPNFPIAGVETLIPTYSTLSEREQQIIRYSIYPLRHFLPGMLEESVRHHILDYSQQVSSVPELSYMKTKRTRTFDGRLYVDIRGIGGENAVTGREDLWNAIEASFNTFAHEFAHQAMEFGFSSADRIKIENLYAQAKKQNLFLDEYAGSNSEEYFAQGYEAYISFFKRPWVGDTYKNTHLFLKQKDPDLYQFLQEKTDPKFLLHPFMQDFLQQCSQLRQEFE